MNLKRLLGLLLAIYIAIVVYSTLAIAWSWPRPMVLLAFSTLLGFAFALLHQAWRGGWTSAFILFLCTAGVGLGLEVLGVATGLVYGPYHYTGLLGYKVFGLVPLMIPLAWFMMGAPSMAMAERLVPSRLPRWGRALLIAAISALIMTSWDLAMDPMMVAGGHWVWERPGEYFGIPIQNYLGWWLTAFTAVLLYQALSAKRENPDKQQPVWLALLFYAVAGLSTAAIDIIAGLPGPGFVGAFVMLGWILAAAMAQLNQANR